jgi:hypothetical protein
MPQPNTLYPPEYRAIDWQQPDMTMVEEAQVEQMAIQKYKELIADASFPTGIIVDAHA